MYCRYVLIYGGIQVFQCVCVFTGMCIRGICSLIRISQGKNISMYIYIIYIESVSFAYNMQTATWWSDSTEVHLQKGAEGGDCVHRRDGAGWQHLHTPNCDFKYNGLEKGTQVNFSDTFKHVVAVPVYTACKTCVSQCQAYYSSQVDGRSVWMFDGSLVSNIYVLLWSKRFRMLRSAFRCDWWSLCVVTSNYCIIIKFTLLYHLHVRGFSSLWIQPTTSFPCGQTAHFQVALVNNFSIMADRKKNCNASACAKEDSSSLFLLYWTNTKHQYGSSSKCQTYNPCDDTAVINEQ